MTAGLHALAVTVSSAGTRLIPAAREAALKWGLPFYHRARNTGLEDEMGSFATAFLVLGGDGWTLRDEAVALRFSLGMAALRIKRIEAGHPLDDSLVKLTELTAGDTVLDGTLGLAADASVCAYVVGPTGKVIGVESSLPLYALVSEGVKPLGLSLDVRFGDARDLMASMPARSVDCVVLDPMFDRPKKASPTFELLRKFADHRPLTPETIEHARRIARRWVVVKGGRYTHEFRRLGLKHADTNRSKSVVWSRVEPLP